MRASIIFALLPLALASPIPDNRSSQQANRIKDGLNKAADVANAEVAAVQRGESAIKNGQSPKPAEQELQRQLNKGVALRKQNQEAVAKLPGGRGRKRSTVSHAAVLEQAVGSEEEGEGQPGTADNVKPVAITVRATDSVEEVQAAVEHLESRSKDKAAQGLKFIEQKQNNAQNTVNNFKGNAKDAAALAGLRTSFQNGNAKLSSLTGEIPGKK